MGIENLQKIENSILKSRDLERKLGYCAKYLELNPNDMDVWEYRSKILEMLGRDKEAIESYERSVLFISDPSYLTGLVTNNLDRAVELFNNTLEKDPKNARVWISKGAALNGLGRPEEAIICFDEANKLDISEIYKTILWYERGLAFSNLKNFKEAIKCLDKSLEIDPGDPNTWATKGIFLIQDEIKKYKEALICFNEVLRINPVNLIRIEAEAVEDGIKIAKKKLRE